MNFTSTVTTPLGDDDCRQVVYIDIEEYNKRIFEDITRKLILSPNDVFLKIQWLGAFIYLIAVEIRLHTGRVSPRITPTKQLLACLAIQQQFTGIKKFINKKYKVKFLIRFQNRIFISINDKKVDVMTGFYTPNDYCLHEIFDPEEEVTMERLLDEVKEDKELHFWLKLLLKNSRTLWTLSDDLSIFRFAALLYVFGEVASMQGPVYAFVDPFKNIRFQDSYGKEFVNHCNVNPDNDVIPCAVGSIYENDVYEFLNRILLGDA